MLGIKNTFIFIIGGTFFEGKSFPNIFAHLKYNSTNGSAWTLPYEFQMYILVLLLGLSKILTKRFVTLLIFFSLILVAAFKVDVIFNVAFPLLFKIKNYEGTYLSLPYCFGMGVLFFLFKGLC